MLLLYYLYVLYTVSNVHNTKIQIFADGRLVREDNIRVLVSASTLTWFIRYILLLKFIVPQYYYY